MRFKSLSIENFRAIRKFRIDDLTDFILIAGPNGCGKSCVFDAIRLLKSAYGGYGPDELMQWLGEFQIDFNREATIRRLFRNLDEPIRIAATIQLEEGERGFLDENAENLLNSIIWDEISDRPAKGWRQNISAAPLAAVKGYDLGELSKARAETLRESLKNDSFELFLEVRSEHIRKFGTNPFTRVASPAMEAAFQVFKPDSIGVIEYHSASRDYQREEIGNVDINPQATQERSRQYSLYNWRNKYQNIKAELASTYLRELVAKEAGIDSVEPGLNDTLKELFNIFFPDKSYQNVQPQKDGGLIFPVKLSSGEEHDINELSSGEKEVLYGYLRLRNSTPRNSIILLDEPELHLNPALVRGLPEFYHRHIGQAYGNQIWMVTHSDTLLRQAVGNISYSVFHMSAGTTAPEGSNQALAVIADNELERATFDLVGDLATYRPKSKVVIFEGGGDTKFDVTMTQDLFPELDRRANLISGGSKKRARDVYEILEKNAYATGTADRFFAITDSDSDPFQRLRNSNHMLSWDVYHIENYLLNPVYLLAASNSVLSGDKYASTDELLAELKLCAQQMVSSLATDRLRRELNDRLVNALKIKVDAGRKSPAIDLYTSITSSMERISTIQEDLTAEKVETLYSEQEAVLNLSIQNGSWIQDFPGRRILTEFAQMRLKGKITYDGLRNLTIARMKEDGYRPPGMKKVIDGILSSS